MRVGRIAVPFLCVLFLASCGTGEENPLTRADDSPLAAITLAADKTAGIGTARVAIDMTMTTSEGEMRSTGQGVFDIEARLGEMTMEVAGPGMPGGMTMDGVFDGMVIYMRYPPEIADQMPGGKPWIRMDLQAAGAEAGLDFNAMMQGASSDPTQSLHYLRGASGEVETVGEEDVRGTPTTHYKAVIDFDKVAAQSPPDARDAMEKNIEVIKEWLGTDTAPFETWIDEEGYMRRMKMAFSYESGPAAGTDMSMTMDMYDFGVEADIQVPPPSQVTDLAELMEKMQGKAP